MVVSEWVRLPSAWIDKGGLAELSWKSGGEGADKIAALMVLIALAHAADQTSGVARRTYEHIGAATVLSRAKIANGLTVLRRSNLIQPGPEEARSTYRLSNFPPGHHWAKLPAKSMYAPADTIAAFAHFQLRRPTELDALKLFLLFLARRDRNTNLTNIGYPKIEQYTGIKRARIKPALSFLAVLPLVYVERVSASTGISNAYRIVGLDSYNHLGTRGRAMNRFDLQNSPTDAGTHNQPGGTPPDYTPFLK
jgi:hypothetical protein